MTDAATTHPITLAIDIGGTGLKASVLDPTGTMLVDRVRILTEYPCPPTDLVTRLVALVEPLGAFHRASVGFPGVVRGGVVLTAPNLSRSGGPGTDTDPDLVEQWHRFDLASALAVALGRPTRVLNDADLQGIDVATGNGLELVVTLGTGFGTSLFQNGRLAPHLELAHHPFRKGDTYDEQLGDAARKDVGNKRWRERVDLALATLDTLLLYDTVYLGGGNTKHLGDDLPPKAQLIDPNAGLLGGIKLWDDTPEP